MSAKSFKREKNNTMKREKSNTTVPKKQKRRIIVFSDWHWLMKRWHPELSKREIDLILTKDYENGLRFKYKWFKTIEE